MPETGETAKILRRALPGPTTSSAPALNICQRTAQVLRAVRFGVFFVDAAGADLAWTDDCPFVRNVFPTTAQRISEYARVVTREWKKWRRWQSMDFLTNGT